MGLGSGDMSVRRTTRWFIGIALATMMLLAIGVALRAPLAEYAAKAYLAARGFPSAAVSVSHIGLERTVIDDLALGPGFPSIKRIELRYRPTEIIGRRLRAVRIDGLRAIVDGRDPTALARLGRLLPSGGLRDDNSPAEPGPTVEVADARIILRNSGIAEASLAFHGTLDLSQPTIRASFDGQAQGDFGQASLTAQATDLFGRPTVRIEGNATADLARLPWPAPLGPRPQGGTMQLSFSGNVPVPPLEKPAVAGQPDREGSLAVNLQLRGAILPPYAASADAHASLTARMGGSGVVSLGGPIAVRLDGLRAGSLAVKDLAIKGTLGLSAGLGKPTTATLSDGTAAVSAPFVFGDLHIESPVSLAIPSARLARAPDGPITLDVRVLPEGLAGTLALKGDQRVNLRASAKEIDLSLHSTDPIAGQVQLRGGSLHLPGQDILAEQIEATIPLPLRSGGGALLSATVSTASGRLAPLIVDGHVTVEGDAFLLNGSIGSSDHGVQIPFQARYLGTTPRGSLALGPATLTFRPNALQPAALGSAFAMATRAEGEVEMSAALTVAPDAPLDGKAGIAFRDLTVTTAEGVIEKLNGAIRLEGLFPLRTAGEQMLSARRAVAGVPLEEPSLRFHLEPTTAGTALVVDHAEGKIAEGTIHLDGARFDPSAARNAIIVGIDDLSLDRLLRDYAMEGMSGTGTLSGVIPMTFSPAGVTIESGALKAEGSGILKVAWGSARDTLMRQGEQVTLMVRALEDFHYSSLRITINRPVDGSLSVRVAMEGHNPAVKDGYPFRFNIALGGELEKILAAIREGGRLGTDFFRGSLGGAP